MQRKNLVIVRAGDSSLHPGWLGTADTDARTWDLIVNYFGDDLAKYRNEDCIRIDSKGPKWPALHDLIVGQKPLVERYEYVWLPDDDLECTCDDVNRLFDVCTQAGLDLAQPSLTPDSYFSHAITLNSPFFRLRHTSFVEIMAPCFSRETLFDLLPSFNMNLSGWGLDYLWPRRLSQSPTKVGIVDAVQVRHTRPVGAANYGALKTRGITAFEEMNRLLESHGILNRSSRVVGAVLPSGRTIHPGPLLHFLYGLGLLRAGAHSRQGLRWFLRVWFAEMVKQTRG